ncbi:MAG: tetratricopeptide repeat protein [Myxococcales bacterium]|nr:tetratricopeptide repeat protein [Myxococcota bacterium]MDW8282341.1 tetratricopeptide repeat protein [Myxococcales bacterium]
MCPACRAQTLPGATRCQACGAALSPQPAQGWSWTVETSLPGLGPAPSASTPLRGRVDLLAQLDALGEEVVRQQQVRFCLVVGAPGMGKTRLLGELEQALAARGMRVLLGSAAYGPPLGPLMQALAQRCDVSLRDPPSVARDKVQRLCQRLLPGARGTEVARHLADLLQLPEEGSPEPRAQRSETRLFQALRRFLQADAAQGPLALLLDEMEHAQPESVNLLHYLAAGLSGSPVMLCAFARPEIDEVHPSFGQGEVPCVRIEVPPLSEADAVHLLDALSRDAGPPPPEVTDHVAQHLGGSPRAIVELLRLLEEQGALTLSPRQQARWDLGRLAALELPGSLEEIVAARLAAMEPATRTVLEHAAICGEHFFLDAVVALGRAGEVGLGMPPGEGGSRRAPDPDGPTLEEIVVAGDRTTQQVKAALRLLCQRGLLIPIEHSSIRGERQYRFAYPPWRDVVYDGIPPARRRCYHGLLAQWLDLTADGEREEIQEAIGAHLMRAGKGEAAALRYLRAAGLARDRYAHGRATRLLARAIACLGTQDLATRIRLWDELGSLFHLRGDYENALGAYEKVVRLSWVLASRGKAASALLHMGEVWRQKGELQLSLDYLGQALEMFRQSGDLAGTSDTLDDIAQVLWLLGRYEEALGRAGEALEIRRRLGHRGKIAASLLSIGNIERHRGLLDAAAACYEEALGLSRACGDRAGIAACLNAIGMLAFQRGDLQGARRTWEEALGLAESAGTQPLSAVLQCHIGDSLLRQGLLAEAEGRYGAAEKLARELEDRRLLSESARSLGLIALRRGDMQQAHARCTEALRLAEAAGVRLDVARALLALGEVHAATLYDAEGGAGQRGEPKALVYFRRGVALLRELGNPAELVQGLIGMGRYLVECGQSEQGAALLREAEAMASRLQIDPGAELRALLQGL